MIEPETPVTIVMKHTHYPAFLLASDEGKPLKPTSVILRHRHLRQQQRVLQGLPANDLPAAKPTRGTSVPLPVDVGALPVIQSDVSGTHSMHSQGVDTSSRIVSPDAGPVQEQAAHTSVRPHDNIAGSDTDTSAVPSSPMGSLLPTVAALNPLRPASFPERSDSPRESPWKGLNVARHERSIRSRNEKTTWFASSGDALLQTPPKLPLARTCDLYVHSSTSGDKQAWILANTLDWVSVDLGHPHPYLKGYLLNFCANGEPSWVTKDTVRTYKGRTKKRTGRLISSGGSPTSK